MDLYERIKTLAAQKNESLTAIEEHLGMGNGVIGKWKKQDPSSRKLLLVANYLGTTTDFLLTGNSQLPSNGNINNSGSLAINNHAPVTIKNGHERELTKQEQDLIRIYNSIDGKKQMELMYFVYNLVEE